MQFSGYIRTVVASGWRLKHFDFFVLTLHCAELQPRQPRLASMSTISNFMQIRKDIFSCQIAWNFPTSASDVEYDSAGKHRVQRALHGNQ